MLNIAEKRYDEAAGAFARANRRNPANSRALMGLVEVEITRNRPGAALAVIEAEVAKSPTRIDLLTGLGNTQIRTENYDAAIATFTKLLTLLDETNKARGDIYLRLGEAYRRKNDLPNATDALRRARAILPQNVVVISTLATVLDAGNRIDEAREAYEATLQLDPANGVALNNLAYLLAKNGGDLDQALTYAQRAKQLLPQLDDVSDTLGFVYLQKKLTDPALDIFRALVQRAPTATHLYHLGLALLQKGDTSAARELFQKALESNPNPEQRQQIEGLLRML